MKMKKEERTVKGEWNKVRGLLRGRMRRKGGMEMVQVAILVAIAIGLGLIFRSEITDFVNDIFDTLTSSGF